MYNTLIDLMTGICEAVREKEGSSELIPAPDIPERISGIKNNMVAERILGIENGMAGVSMQAITFSNMISFAEREGQNVNK